MIQIIEENNNLDIVIEVKHGKHNIVVLFPMTRGISANLFRWQKLISTVNYSKVATLVLIDKTPKHQATDYFISQGSEISADVVVVKRPRTEPIHDSQSRIRLKDGLWIIQLHDDDDWDGVLEVPVGTDVNSVIKTNFTILKNSLKVTIDDKNFPDCRSIFSLLPASVWNRFVDLIVAQGGHVAGSIDSSLNLAVSLIKPNLLDANFKYTYDNRHWESKRRSKAHLKQLTQEDGWGIFATVDMSLVSRAIDGISSLIFFSDLYSEHDLEGQIKKWMEVTKPHYLRVLSKRVEIVLLMLCMQLLGVIPGIYSRRFFHSGRTKILYRRILLSAWDADEIKNYISVVETLMEIDFLAKLQPRFHFWESQLKKISL